MTTTKRVSMTMNKDLLSDLDFLSRNLRVSRSSLINELLSATSSEMRRIVECTNALTDGSPESISLARDPSKVRSYLDSISQAIDHGKTEFDRESLSLLQTMDGSSHEH